MLGATSLTAAVADVDSEAHLVIVVFASETTQAVAGPALLAPQMEATNRAAGTAKVASGHALVAKVIICP